MKEGVDSLRLPPSHGLYRQEHNIDGNKVKWDSTKRKTNNKYSQSKSTHYSYRLRVVTYPSFIEQDRTSCVCYSLPDAVVLFNSSSVQIESSLGLDSGSLLKFFTELSLYHYSQFYILDSLQKNVLFQTFHLFGCKYREGGDIKLKTLLEP